jgi:hypothetical protein
MSALTYSRPADWFQPNQCAGLLAVAAACQPRNVHGIMRRPSCMLRVIGSRAKLTDGALPGRRHYVNQTAHPEFDPLQRRHSVLSAAFYDQMVVLVRKTDTQIITDIAREMQESRCLW